MNKIMIDSSWILYFATGRREDLPCDKPAYSVGYLWSRLKKKVREFFTDGPADILIVIDENHPDVNRVNAVVIHSCVKSYQVEIIKGWMFIEVRTWNDAQSETVKDLLLEITPSQHALNPMAAAAA